MIEQEETVSLPKLTWRELLILRRAIVRSIEIYQIKDINGSIIIANNLLKRILKADIRLERKMRKKSRDS